MAKAELTGLSPAQLARRAEIGVERRARTRERLLEAAYRLFAVHGAEAPTIDDVIAAAGVARGTFYNHFLTRDDLFKAVADDIATSINALILPKLAGMPDPAERLALAFRMFVQFAVADDTRGWILLRTMPLVGSLNDQMKTFIHSEFDAVLKSGRFRARSTLIAVDLGMGFMIMTIHRLLVDRCPKTHVNEAAEMLLLAMGMEEAEAADIANRKMELVTIAPELIRPARS